MIGPCCSVISPTGVPRSARTGPRSPGTGAAAPTGSCTDACSAGAACRRLLDLTHWTVGPDLDRALAGAPPHGLPRPGPDAPVVQLYTSGTTGRPKGCLLTNRGWVAAAANAVQAFGLTAADRLLGALPLFHVAGYGAALGQLAAPGTVGRPLPAFDLALDGAGEVGELLLRGAGVMAGYAGHPAPPGDDWLRTGDLMRLDADGRLFFFDRAKDMVKSGGENDYCAEVERVLAAHPGVRDAAVIGVPDRRWGEAVKALVVVRGGTSPADLDAHCRARLGAFKRPRWYEVVEAIPRNHSGKVRKRELRAAHDPGAAVRLPESGG